MPRRYPQRPKEQSEEHPIDTAIIVALIGVVGTAFGIWFRSYLADRGAAKAKRAAAAEAFLTALTEDALSAPTLAVYAYQNFTTNVRAVDAFRKFVPRNRQSAYTKAENEYHAACQTHCNMGPLASLSTDLSSTAVSDRIAIIDAIEKLRSFAK